MKLAESTWTQIRDLDRDTVVLIPTGSIEQHGPHLPLITDTLLATSVAEAAERTAQNITLLTPTVWLGASAHHMGFDGTLSASFEGYDDTLRQVIASLADHGFHRFFVLNGHGGNTAPNDIALRRLKQERPNLTLVGCGYFQLIDATVVEKTLEGPLKSIMHACEAETSLMLHLRPDLVHMQHAEDDGLWPEPQVSGLSASFSELSANGPIGYPTLATDQKGEALFAAAVEGVVSALRELHDGIAFLAR